MLVSITLTLVDRNWEKICCLLINCFKIKLQLLVKESFTVRSRTQYVYSQSCFLLFSFGALLHAKILKQHRRVLCLCTNYLPYIFSALKRWQKLGCFRMEIHLVKCPELDLTINLWKAWPWCTQATKKCLFVCCSCNHHRPWMWSWMLG